jgi:dTDP-4-amino-4,6-dideoxygalactose transaminase
LYKKTMSNLAFIPYHAPAIGEEEIQEVIDTLRSGWLTTGPRTARFEQDFRTYAGCKHALALNSGTAALHLPLVGLGIGPGDEVITTPTTFCSTVSSILHTGATPVLADVDANGNIDPASIARRITPRTRAILPVHLAGRPCDMDAIWDLAAKNNLSVIEDAAHAAGTLYRGTHCGSAVSLSDAVAFSFYATKNITTGEGGMVITNNGELAGRMRRLALHGISKDAWNRYAENGKWQYEVLEPGFKYNLSDIQSSIGIHQLRKLEGFIETRTALARIYNEKFADVEEVITPSDCDYGRHAWHLYILHLKLDRLTISRDEFISEMKARGIGTSVHFIPIPLHPFFASWATKTENQCPRALERYRGSVSLPLYPGLCEQQQRRVISAVKDTIYAAAKSRTVRMGVSA